MKRERIQELDIFRGFCMLGVIGDHIHYDLTVFLGLSVPLPSIVTWFFTNVGLLFILLSGLCTNLTKRSLRRGIIVLCCGLAISIITLTADQIIGGSSMGIHFGILHLLGVCMLLSPLLKKLPTAALLVLGILTIVLGAWMQDIRVTSEFLFPLGLRYTGFRSADYWPLFPYLGWFLIGIGIGRLLYREKQPRVPVLQGRCRFLAFCGRHSLEIYLIHQPILLAVFYLLM